MIVLRVGDPHIRPSNLDDANRLMEFIKKLVSSGKIDRLEFLGDLFHTHAVIRLEVLGFWDRWLIELSDIVETVALVGNHDMTGTYNSNLHSLMVFKRIQNDKLKIIDSPTKIGPFGYLPYIHGKAEFISASRILSEQGSKVLVCHTTFDGSQFDNGFYAPEGVDPNEVPFDTIISGHIHKEQRIFSGKVDYPGTPKWDSASDANERKGVWLYEHDDVSGEILARDCISTEKVCTPIISLAWTEGQEQPTIPDGSKASIELIGTSDWISKQKTKLKGKASIRSTSTDQKRDVSKRKAGNSLENYLKELYSGSIDNKELMEFAQEIGIV